MDFILGISALLLAIGFLIFSIGGLGFVGCCIVLVSRLFPDAPTDQEMVTIFMQDVHKEHLN